MIKYNEKANASQDRQRINSLCTLTVAHAQIQLHGDSESKGRYQKTCFDGMLLSCRVMIT